MGVKRAALCAPFRANNGVCQSGIMYPILFDVLLGCSIRKLNWYNTGSFVVNIVANHLMYVDDLLTFSPHSVAGRQTFKLSFPKLFQPEKTCHTLMNLEHT